MSNGRAWTADDTATVRRMAGSGASDAEIAAYMHRDVKMIGRKRRDMGVERGISIALAVMMCRINGRRRGRRA